MLRAFTGSQVRDAERPLLERGMGRDLMARAAHGLYRSLVAELRRTRGGLYGARVTAVVGKGNNGGDALFALAELAGRGVRTTAILASGSAHTEGLAAFLAAGGRVERTLGRADIVVDAVLGTGASGDYRAPFPRPEGIVVACDLPSGVDADSGTASPEVWRADVTVTFGALKSGLLAGRGRALAGRVEVIDIGIGEYLPQPDVYVLEAEDVRGVLPEPRDDWQKYTRGVLGVIAGSDQYPGAAVLTTSAALATGVGMVRHIAPESVRRAVLAAHPEVVASGSPEGRVQAWAVGPGIGDDAGQQSAFDVALDSGLPIVVDASGLNRIPGPPLDGRAVLTPHAGELARVLSRLGLDVERPEVEERPIRWARLAAERLGATVLLKGPATVCAAPDGTVCVQAVSHPYLATAGSGDTLTGIVGALLATTSYARPVHVAAAAAMVHGRAGRIAAEGGPFGAGELSAAVRQAVAAFQGGVPEAPLGAAVDLPFAGR
ncbi:NAD(P)H-hydrate dehydratase [Sinomonas terrae]|uniref:ADP-dependent (S)-NAD(P)H-hydrate dehydratase n=1 Tax=Sinomonas terrae TaxID=2908838 RepID=A0ABS9TYN9_9MICC|nr:NAD(P)H-hydrate dehydratase [Sinomonas terrae]MCH6469382.1 NAD(P)H-hydrate dehydratase [Sinomonas terrae]